MSEDPAPYAPPVPPASERMAVRLMNEAIQHGHLHAECAHDSSHGCVVVWAEGFIEHAAALFDAYARQQGALLP